MNGPAHSILGPSSAERWINCPGSVALTRDLPDVDSDYSIEGTAAHTVLEIMRKGEPVPKMVDVPLVNRVPMLMPVTEEMVAAAQYYIDHMAELPGIEFNEVRVAYEAIVSGGFGTLDGAKATEDTLYLRDFKFGKGVIKYAERNPQLMLYALGFVETYGLLFPGITRFNLGIVQPRSDHVDVWECTLEELTQWAANEVQPIASKIGLPQYTLPVKAGEWCQFCKIKATCRVRAQTAVASVIGDFDLIADTGTLVKQPSATMSNEQMAHALASVPILKAWIKDLEGGALLKIARGESVGDYKIVESRTNREWKGPENELATRLNNWGVKPYKTPELVSPAAAEKIIGKKQFTEMFACYVDKPQGRAVLAPGTDKRPPLGADVIKDFDVIPEQ